MSGNAGYKKKLLVSSDNSTWLDTEAINITLNQSTDMLETTNTSVNDGYHSRIGGLHDWSINASILFDISNLAFKKIRDSWKARSVLYIQYLPKTTVANGGYTGKISVESMNFSGDVNSLEMAEITFQGNGELADAT